MATAGLGTTRHVAEAARADRHESGRSAAGSWRTARQKGRRSNRQFKFAFLRFVFLRTSRFLFASWRHKVNAMSMSMSNMDKYSRQVCEHKSKLNPPRPTHAHKSTFLQSKVCGSNGSKFASHVAKPNGPHSFLVPMPPASTKSNYVELIKNKGKSNAHIQFVHTQLVHTQLHHTQHHTTYSQRLGVAGVELVALGWLWWRACFPVDAVDGAAAGVAGVALTELGWVCWRAWFHFAWHAWHLATSTSTSHGRCGTCGTGLGLVARLVPSGRRGRHGCWRARRGTWPHQPPLCVVSVPLGDIALHFAWHAWHLATSTFTLRDIDFHFAWHAWHLPTSTCTLRHVDLHFAWQAWHLATSTFTLAGARGRAAT